MEAFSDGVIAVIITILVLELKVPHGESIERSAPVSRILSYVLSFIYVGIYWNNHHHMLHATRRVRARAVGEPASPVLAVAGPVHDGMDGREPLFAAPSALYGFVLLMAAIAYWMLQQRIIASEGATRSCARRLAATGKASCHRCSTRSRYRCRSGRTGSHRRSTCSSH
jgi:uncharacterized membrane protein